MDSTLLRPRRLAMLTAIMAGLILGMGSTVRAADLMSPVRDQVQSQYPSLRELYLWLHQHPELSFGEKETSRRLAAELRKASLEVTENVGGYGVVGVFKNGSGPTVLIRADMDALPVKEMTGLPYASTATTTDDSGATVPVMHACGHDLHMTCLAGTARTLVALKDHWSGTLVFIGQPAEERVGGARAMLKDGLYTRFPKPDFCLALHASSDMPTGTIGYTEGFSLANVDGVDITVRGIGGHGSRPQDAKDPIVLAAEIVVALQTIVSREIDPQNPSVVTVGTIHGGTKRNIIPDEVTLKLTLRSYSGEVRQQLIKSIRRICDGMGRVAGLPDDLLPVVTIADESASAVYNNPALTLRVVTALRSWLGESNAIRRRPVMGAEDFGELGQTVEKVPVLMFWLGTISPESFAASLKGGKALPTIHSGYYAPDMESSLKTGVTAMSAAVLELVTQR
jgi:amidohydrolase